ncbi:dihydroorotase [Synechococcus sp. PCC 7336]|uniref:dihydroorotase n=1 Tax=Synechococcus sp. PCC 7336 TaxID=195250 RepID=UPI000367E11E|nr:dihydroorotase [Synechococcus sp. PCC 7336]
MFASDRSYLLNQIRIVDPAGVGDRLGDVWIAGGVLRAIEDSLQVPEGTDIVDGRDWAIGPGLVDLYAQSGEPGFEQRETVESLGKAAIAGGFTQVALLPTTHPVADDPAQLEAIRQQARPGHTPHWHPLAAITRAARGETMTELAELAASGAAGFCDGRPIDSVPLLRRLLEYVQPLGKPLLLWPQERSLAGGAMLEGEWSVRLGLKGIPSVAESIAVATAIELVRYTHTPIHLMRLTQARSLELVESARAAGLPVTASTSWMHLLLCDRDVELFHYHPALHLHAPLGTATDRQALIDAVRAGTLSAIATDHTPYTFEEKTVSFAESPPGAIGLELALPMLWQQLVETDRLSATELWSALSVGPAKVLQAIAPKLDLGQPANCTILAPYKTWTCDRQSMHTLSAATPWWGQTVTGKVLGCWLDGRWQSSDRL